MIADFRKEYKEKEQQSLNLR
jgi:hypothetical protein